LAVADQIDKTERRQARLTRAEEIAGPAQREITLGNLESVRRLGHRLQPLARLVGKGRLIYKEAVRLVPIAADAAAELVQLRQTEALGVLDEHHARVLHVDAYFDDRRRDEDVDVARGERLHHEHIRMQRLRPERRALQYAEPMLLVDDGQSELLEANVALHERVRADDQVDRARVDFGELLATGGGGRRSGELRHAEARRLQQAGDVKKMLLGEDLGGRHEGDLQSVLHRHERREQRDDGLAGADVPLQQAGHR